MSEDDISLEKEQIQAGAEKTRLVCGLIGRFFELVTFLVSIKLFFAGLTPLVGAKPDTLTALAAIIDKLNVANISGYILAAGFFAG